MIFSIDRCTIDTDAYELRRNGNVVPVEPQVFDLLVLLLENRDRVTTKDEIIERVWNGRIVSEAALSSRIKAARQAIGDSGASQALIRTIRRRGFRVVGEVTQSTGPAVEVRPLPIVTEPAPEPATATAAGASEDAGPAAQAAILCCVETVPGPATASGVKSYRETAHTWIVTMPRWRAALGAVTAVLVVCAMAVWYARTPSALSSPLVPAALGMPTGPGLAVLRFKRSPGDALLDFFGDAVTEEIATQLTRFSELRVAARALTAEYDAKEAEARDVGQKLGAEFLLQGSLRRLNEQVRVTAQLLKTADGTLLWAETYERHLTPAGLFAVQEDIAGKVVAAIASISTGAIARAALGQARGKPPRDLSAYECTLRANDIMVAGFSAASHLAIRTCLETAVANEPDYAAAWAMLAWIHSFEYTQGLNKRPGVDALEQSFAVARRAVELAPANPMARFAMARAAYLMRDLHLFYAEAAGALRLNPHEPFLLGNLGSWFAFSGRWEEGITLVRKAIALNPKVYPRWWHAALGKDRFRKREFAEALIEFKKMNLPDWWWNQVELAYTYGHLGDLENARKAVIKLYELYPGFDLEKAVMEHRKFSFEESYIELAVEGLRKAGIGNREAAIGKQ
ncbi:MAG: winged helix-turn-helix domain-containing tetratricopeptide repeat protein [Hyphomicrobiaceae bacterium]